MRQYEYLYRSLATQFECGAFLQRKTLPSQQQLCKYYNVGITTIRKVIGLLEENGYIRTAAGKQAAITYRAEPEAYIGALARRRSEVADAFCGLGLLLPPLYREGAKRCKEAELQKMQEAVDGITDGMGLSMVYRQVNLFFAALLGTFQNHLILDLELDAENYLHIPHLPFTGEKDPLYRTAGGVKGWLQAALEQIRQKQFDLFYNRIVRTYAAAGRDVDNYLAALSRHVPVDPTDERDIQWFRVKDRSELYLKLALSILRRIMGGEFDGQKYLPSIPRLMEEYGVMKDTASRAVALLNKIGAVQTLDKKGTVVASEVQEYTEDIADFKDTMIRQRLKFFLGTIEIMALTARSCAAAFPTPSKDWVEDMEKRLSEAPDGRISSLSVQLLMGCMIHLAPSFALKNIFSQLNEQLLWGYYLRSVERSPKPDLHPVTEAMKAVTKALKEPAHSALPSALERAFLLIYEDVQTAVNQAIGERKP